VQPFGKSSSRRFRADTNGVYRGNVLPNEELMKKGKSSLQAVEELISPDLPKQVTGVASLRELYSQLESFYASATGLGSSAALMWEAFHTQQALREHLFTLGGQISDLLSTMDDFEAKRSSMSIHVGANLLDPAIRSLSDNYRRYCEDTAGLIQKLKPENLDMLQMLQNSVLRATGVEVGKTEGAEPGNDGDWEQL
jgi:hypothetical protein